MERQYILVAPPRRVIMRQTPLPRAGMVMEHPSPEAPYQQATPRAQQPTQKREQAPQTAPTPPPAPPVGVDPVPEDSSGPPPLHLILAFKKAAEERAAADRALQQDAQKKGAQKKENKKPGKPDAKENIPEKHSPQALAGMARGKIAYEASKNAGPGKTAGKTDKPTEQEEPSDGVTVEDLPNNITRHTWPDGWTKTLFRDSNAVVIRNPGGEVTAMTGANKDGPLPFDETSRVHKKTIDGLKTVTYYNDAGISVTDYLTKNTHGVCLVRDERGISTGIGAEYHRSWKNYTGAQSPDPAPLPKNTPPVPERHFDSIQDSGLQLLEDGALQHLGGKTDASWTRTTADQRQVALDALQNDLNAVLKIAFGPDYDPQDFARTAKLSTPAPTPAPAQ